MDQRDRIALKQNANKKEVLNEKCEKNIDKTLYVWYNFKKFDKRSDAEQYADILAFREMPVAARHWREFAELTAERLP